MAELRSSEYMWYPVHAAHSKSVPYCPALVILMCRRRHRRRCRCRCRARHRVTASPCHTLQYTHYLGTLMCTQVPTPLLPSRFKVGSAGGVDSRSRRFRLGGYRHWAAPSHPRIYLMETNQAAWPAGVGMLRVCLTKHDNGELPTPTVCSHLFRLSYISHPFLLASLPASLPLCLFVLSWPPGDSLLRLDADVLIHSCTYPLA